MKTVRMTITPWANRGCHRVVEFSENHSLYDVHQMIQIEFQLDDDHLWAFFLSGDYFDLDTEFGTGSRARSPHLKLAELCLGRGQRIAYVFDFGDELRHDLTIDSIDDATLPLETPKVVERVGTHPLQYRDFDVEQTEDHQEERPKEAVDFPLKLLADVETTWAMLDEIEEAPLTDAQRETALELVRDVLDVCPDGERLDALSRVADESIDLLLFELLGAIRTGGVTAALEQLEWRFARLPRPHPHSHGFAPELVANVRWAIQQRFAMRGEEATERRAAVPLSALAPICDQVLDACPDFGRLALLSCEVEDNAVFDLLLDRAALSAGTLDDAQLGPLLERTARSMGKPEPFVVASHALSKVGQHVRAGSVLKALESQLEQLAPLQRLQVAKAYESAQLIECAEPIYRALLELRWLSGRLRPDVVAGLTRTLSAQGRNAELRKLQQLESARERELQAERSGTFVRKAPKVGRNEPCPCGSGKKVKKCCAAGA